MAANQPTSILAHVDSLEFLSNTDTLSVLQDAGQTFVKQADNSVEIWAASRDWFLEPWGRDTFISLPGLLLTTKRYEQAKQVFRRFAAYEQDGLIPNVIRDNTLLYNTVDASLWFIHALRAYLEATDDWSFMASAIPTVRNIITGYTKGTSYEHAGRQHRIAMDTSDGLIVSSAQATWMDADPSGNEMAIVTPRNGKCVEINALWYGALRFVIDVEKKFNEASDTAELDETANRVRLSFASKFWNPDTTCLFDVIEGDPHGAAIRPNQVIAISHGRDLLELDKQQQILTVVERDLLTPAGLRTLSPHDPQYKGHYETSAPMSIKDLAYHQGTVWPWLIGPYCDALRIVQVTQGKPYDVINHQIETLISPLVRFCLDSEFKSLPEVFSGDPPYEPGGTTSQAWSVAEVLRIVESVQGSASHP
jgi:predicted glycogen debranching enzyme